MNLVKGTTNISLKHFDVAVISTFVLSALLILFFVSAQQTKLADYFVQASLHGDIELIERAPSWHPDLISVEKPTDTSSASFFTTDVTVDTQYSLRFTHPFIVLMTTPAFWLYLVLYFSAVMFLRERLKERNANKLAPITELENWLQLSETSRAETALPSNSVIAKCINTLQDELTQAQRGQSRFDQELRESALLDPATRIGNREFFTSHLEATLREEDSRGAVFLIQLKGCELVQNLYGEEQALKLLDTAIESIKSRIANISDCFLSRREEYELAVLTPGLFVDDAEKLAERLLGNLTSLSLPIGVNKEEFCHIGISYFKQDRKHYQIMSEADMALRSAQLQGPSQWFMYDPGEVARESAIGSLKWRTFLHQVIENKSFIIFSQPVVDVKKNEVLHYEVLSKIKNSRGQLISPRIFLPMAEKCGLSSELDLIVFQQVCELINYEAQDTSYSLNLSIDALLSDNFRAQLYALIANYPNVAQKLIIEISEYHLKSRINELIPVLSELKKKGFRILADKVGQYVVNAGYLEQCHISYVKLHRSIILDIDQKPENQVFVQSMKLLCDKLDVNLFAVGVESIDEWRTLMKIGICGGQGHYFNEPVAQIANAID